MLTLDLLGGLTHRSPLVVALGAHCDDIEIGAGGLLLQLADTWPDARLHAVVLTSTPERDTETRACLKAFAGGLALDVTVMDLPDGRLPAHWSSVKDALEAAAERARDSGGADLVLTPSRHDRHQDHRLLAELAPTAFRDHLALGYEIHKWEGDLGRPAVHLSVPAELAERKVDLLTQHYASQHDRDWFDSEAFLGLMRLRGVECHSRYAEAFHCDKLVLRLASGRGHQEVLCES